MSVRFRPPRGLTLLVGCSLVGCGEPTESSAARAARPLSMLIPQRVKGAVQKQASQLVHIQTAHETLLVTPEHPFATPDSGWIPAGALSAGDLVVSARFGTVPVSAVYAEAPLRSVPVFNLSVTSSHTYLVGMNQVLVHNTGCKDNVTNLLRRRELGERGASSAAIQETFRRKHQTELVRRALQQFNLVVPGRSRSPSTSPSTSPRAADVQRSLEQLRRRLREERSMYQQSDATLAAQLERLRDGGASADELRAMRVRLREEWRQATQARLDQARARRNPATQAAIDQEIELLESELNHSPF